VTGCLTPKMKYIESLTSAYNSLKYFLIQSFAKICSLAWIFQQKALSIILNFYDSRKPVWLTYMHKPTYRFPVFSYTQNNERLNVHVLCNVIISIYSINRDIHDIRPKLQNSPYRTIHVLVYMQHDIHWNLINHTTFRIKEKCP